MNVPVVSISIDLTLREYARSSSVTAQITMGTTFSGLIGFAMLRALFELIKGAAQVFRQLPSMVQVGIASIALGLSLHPKSRTRIIGFFRSLYQEVLAAKPILLPALSQLANEFFTELAAASETRKQIESALPTVRKLPAIVHARTICLMSSDPLSVPEIEQRMRSHGYLSRSANFGGYLRRLLRASEQFVEVSPGMWRLQQLQPESSSAGL